MGPGEIVYGQGDIEINEGAQRLEMDDRQHRRPPRSGRQPRASAAEPTPRCSSIAPPPTATGSTFPRAPRCGSNPVSPSGSRLVPLGGSREVHGLSLQPARPIGSRDDRDCPAARYAALFGPTTGDRIRLADTDLFVEITEDRSGGPGLAGDEAVFGGGKVLRESMGQGRATRADGAPDTVITGVVILDYWGIIKADIGIRDGRITAIGKAGNPDIMSGVHPGPGGRTVDRDHRGQRPDRHRGRASTVTCT